MMNSQNETVNQQLLAALKDCMKLIDMLMPGVRYIALQDYALLNDAQVNGHEAIAAAEAAQEGT